MNERLTTDLSQGFDLQPAGEPANERKLRARARAEPMPYPEGTSLYTGGFTGHGTLSREDEVELACRIEEGERAILRALIKSPIALRELAAVGRELDEGRLRARDVLRSADEDESGPEETVRHLVAVLGRAGALARAAKDGARVEPGARRHLLEELERIRLHRRILDRVVGALRAAPVKNKATERTLQAVQEGRRIADLATSQIVKANLGLVVSFAKGRFGQGLPIHDLIQEGNIGLMRAADKFDHRRGLRFSTYAAWWIRQQMTRAILDQSKTIRVPVHLAETRHQVRRAQHAFEQVHGRTPSEVELAEQTGFSPEKVQAALTLASEPLSLDTPLGEDHEARLGDLVPDRTTLAPDEEVARARMREQAKQLLEGLSPREQEVLRRRFGLDDAPEQTLAEIGLSLSISRERVRQIEAGALRKLRVPSKQGELETYLGV